MAEASSYEISPENEPTTSETQGFSALTHPDVAQGEGPRYSQDEVREAIDAIINEHQRLRFVSIQRKKIIVSAWYPILSVDVETRLQGVLALLRAARASNPIIAQALRDTNGIVLSQ